MRTAVVWFRRDLRIGDNPALAAAARESGRVVPVFCFEPGPLRGGHASPSRNAYLLAALAELDRSLSRIGGRLLYRHGDPASELPRIAAEAGAEVVWWNRDHTAHARSRDRRVAERLRSTGVEVATAEGVACADVGELRSGSGTPYRVFGPFHRAWATAPRRAREVAPRRIAVPGGLAKGRPPSRSALGVEAGAAQLADAARPGEAAARRLADRAVRRSAAYREDRDELGRDATTRLSIPLHFGCVSALSIEARLRARRTPGAAELRRQLAWRDFWLHVIAHNPANRGREHDPRFRGMRWRHEPESVRAWRQGRTGYPLVDAGMRQLLAEGWMHNRARMVVASFLTKNLLCDWRTGEAHFMRHLLDGDEAQNNGNWQWSASVGADAQPWFRIFNPTRQQRRFDADGTYVRRWVPELAALPDRWLAEPWRAPPAVQRAAGCAIGEAYPEPIVDLGDSRRDARARFAALAGRGR